MMTKKPNNQGFTIIELVIVIVLLGILAVTVAPRLTDMLTSTNTSAVRGQAQALIAQDNLNVMVCEVGNDACIDITTTGDEACQQAIALFLPELDLDVYAVRNISSDIPQAQWGDFTSQSESIFWVTRYLRTPPTADWIAQGWNVRQPCILGRS